MPVKGHVARLVRVVVHMDPRRGQLDAPETNFKQRLKDHETGMGIHTADVHGIPARVGGRGHAPDGLVVLGATVGGRQRKRRARQIAGLVEQMQQIGRFCGGLNPRVTGKFVTGTLEEAYMKECAHVVANAAMRGDANGR